MSECPICMQVKPLLLFPCTHPCCRECASSLSACPTCRQEGEASEPHRQLRSLSRMLHCGQCGTRYSREDNHMPTLLLPCHHHMCRGCLDALEGCPECSRTVTGGVDDSRFMDALENWSRLPPPPGTDAAEGENEEEEDEEGGCLLESLAQWLLDHEEMYTLDWSYRTVDERGRWPATQRQLWNEFCRQVSDLAVNGPELNHSFYDALGLPPAMQAQAKIVDHSTRQAVQGRTLLPELFQRLPVRSYDLL